MTDFLTDWPKRFVEGSSPLKIWYHKKQNDNHHVPKSNKFIHLSHTFFDNQYLKYFPIINSCMYKDSQMSIFPNNMTIREFVNCRWINRGFVWYNRKQVKLAWKWAKWNCNDIDCLFQILRKLQVYVKYWTKQCKGQQQKEGINAMQSR